MKKIVAVTVAVCVLLAVVLFYLVKIDRTTVVSKVANFNIAVILQSSQAAFWQAVANGAKSVVYKQLTLTVDGPEYETDFIRQAGLIDTAVAKKVDAIVIAPHNAAAVIAALQRARAAKIPVVMIDSYLDIGEVLPLVASDNDKIGELAANEILQSGKVSRAIVIRGVWGDESQDARSAAAMRILKDAGVEVVAYENADSDREKAKQLTERLLVRYSGIQAIFATNDYMALGAADAEREAHYPNSIFIIGVDAIPEALQAIRIGNIDATVSQNAFEIGRSGVELAVDILKKQRTSEHLSVPSSVITKANVNSK